MQPEHSDYLGASQESVQPPDHRAQSRSSNVAIPSSHPRAARRYRWTTFTQTKFRVVHKIVSIVVPSITALLLRPEGQPLFFGQYAGPQRVYGDRTLGEISAPLALAETLAAFPDQTERARNIDWNGAIYACVTNSTSVENVQESYLDGLSSIPIWHVYITGSVMAVVFPILEVLWELGEVTTVLQMIFETLDGILSLALTVAATNLLKYIFAWPRPYFCDQLQTWIAENRSTPYDPVSKTVHSEFADTLKSFPSGHSSSSSAIAAIFTVFHIKRLLALISSREHEQYNIGTLLKAVWHTIWIMGIWVFPSIVMSSRIHDHKHSPVDVSFGFLLGVVIPAAVLVVSPALTSRMGKEWNGRSTRRDPSHAHS